MGGGERKAAGKRRQDGGQTWRGYDSRANCSNLNTYFGKANPENAGVGAQAGDKPRLKLRS